MADLYSEFTEHLTPLPGEDNINERRVLGVDEIRINPSRSVIPFDRKMRGDV